MDEKKQAVTGLGGPYGGSREDVETLLHLGSPRLALARKLGVKFQPFVWNVRGTFTNATQATVDNEGADVKITQDLIVEFMEARVTVDRAPLNVFEPISQFFYQYQCGIEANLRVQGAPRYDVAPNFTPLSTLCEIAGKLWPRGWVLSYQQQVMMSFFARLPLADFPITAVVTFGSWVPVDDAFTPGMGTYGDNNAALAKLQELGVDISCYMQAPGR